MNVSECFYINLFQEEHIHFMMFLLQCCCVKYVALSATKTNKNILLEK